MVLAQYGEATLSGLLGICCVCCVRKVKSARRVQQRVFEMTVLYEYCQYRPGVGCICGVNHAGAAAACTARAPCITVEFEVGPWHKRSHTVTSIRSITITRYVLVAVITVQHAETIRFVLVFLPVSPAVSVSLILVRQTCDTAQQYRHHSPNTQARHNHISWILYTMQQPAWTSKMPIRFW